MQKPYLAGIEAVAISFGPKQGYRMSGKGGCFETFDAIAAPNLTKMSRQGACPGYWSHPPGFLNVKRAKVVTIMGYYAVLSLSFANR
jgi:hypothetical protein